MMVSFESIAELFDVFPTEQSCIDHLEQLRWGGGVVSPFDSTSAVYKCKDNKYRCKNTGRYFNVKTNTLFGNSNVPLRKWFAAIWLVACHNKDISSLQLGRDIGVTQKTAWFMLKRIRNCFDAENNNDLTSMMKFNKVCMSGKSKRDYRYLFIDLDGTLIETQSGATFPRGIWDMRFRFDVLEAIKRMSPDVVFIVSNQGGIVLGHVHKVCFGAKLDYVKAVLFEYCGVSAYATYCSSNDKADPMRKPNYGMLTQLWKEALSDGEVSYVFEECEDDMLMVGDASGGEGDFSDSDLRCAERAGIAYMDVEDFVVSFW